MALGAMIDAHARSTRMDIHEVVRRMNTHLGATAVAALAGSRDSKLPYRWAKQTEPGQDAQDRIYTAHRVWLLIADAESDHVARTWFLGNNPILGETSPVLALRAGRTKEVALAAEAFVTGTWHD